MAASGGERTQRADADVRDVDLPRHLRVLGRPSPFCPAGLGPSCPWVTPVCWRAPDLQLLCLGAVALTGSSAWGLPSCPSETGSGASPAGWCCPIAAWRASGHLVACGVQTGAASSHLHPPPETLCLWVRLSWTFPINGITPCVSFCVWLLSLSIVFSGSVHVAASVGASPLLRAE